MTWWLRSRRVTSLLPTAFAFFLLLVLTLQDRWVVMPSFLAGSMPVPLMLSLPVPLSAAVGMCLDSGLADAEAQGTRRVRALDAALVLAVVGAAAGTGLFAWTTLGASDDALAVGRNTAFLMGVMLLLRAVAGPRGVMAPIVWIFLVLFLGRGSAGQPFFWTVLPRGSGDPVAAVAAGVSLAAGLLALLLGRGSPVGEGHGRN
ncbi:hypothetical protein [Streptomyces fradiae]|uniref:hypothetical protein n=1 Tax=Streptomyces fradiae TaxID=1906 RepID=UPI0037FD76B3